jgi:hypothetical protein
MITDHDDRTAILAVLREVALSKGSVVYGAAADELERLWPIVDKAPKDADGMPVEEGRPYFFRCANGVLQFWAYLGPQASSPTRYPWEKGYRTEEAAETAREND